MGPFLMLPTARIVVALCGIVLLSTGCFGIPVENDADDATFPNDLNDVGQAQHEPDADDEPEENNVADDSHGPGDSHNDPILSMFAQSDARVDAQVERPRRHRRHRRHGRVSRAKGFCHGGTQTRCIEWSHGNWKAGWGGLTGVEYYDKECGRIARGSKFDGQVEDCGYACWACKKIRGCCRRPVVKHCGNPYNIKGVWKPLVYTTGETEITYTMGRKSTDSNSRTNSWKTTLSQSVGLGFLFGKTKVDKEFSQGGSRTVSYALEQSTSKEHEFTFNKRGQVWQWMYTANDACGYSKIESQHLVLTDGQYKPPCCLPGYAVVPDQSKCVENSPNSCKVKAWENRRKRGHGRR